jgi:ubiquinone/menaquinone biosynthesis C-methylase UbiE
MSASRTTDADYVLGRTDAEHRRLVQQALFLRPSTERMLRAAGVGLGMRVLDVGCGMGDVSFLVTELVGPSGSVVGIDVDADALAVAEERRAAMTLANVSFVQGDFRSAALGGEFDAAVGRLVLMYQADPTDALRAIARRLRPDGIVAFQEPALRALPWQPQGPQLLTSVVTWMREVFARSGAHMNVGWELYWRMRDAGLRPHSVPLGEVPLGVGPDSVAYDRWATLTRSLQPKIIEYGLATEAEIDIETLEQRLREEALATRATIPLFSGVLVGQWARNVSPE